MIDTPKASFLLLATLLGLASCKQGSNGQEVTAADTLSAEEMLSEAEQSKAVLHFTTYCAGCHGENAATFADRKWKHGNEEADIFKSIKFGHPEAGMPAFAQTFTDEEIRGLAGYIKTGIHQVAQYTFEEEKDLSGTFEAEGFSFKLEPVASGFGEVPWGMAFLPGGDMLITEIGGKLYRRTAAGELQEIAGVPPVLAQGQGGLLDVVLHPDFEQNKRVYLSYAASKEQEGKTLSTTAIMRARLNGNRLSQQKVIFEAQPWQETRHHYGSRLAFGPDGYLYFTVGDRGGRDEHPQQLDRHPGKIHRIGDDGSIPADNPFLSTSGAQGSVFSYGHRNPQGLAFNPQTGVLWEHEHGPRGGDEINIIEPGGNYGWPVISYGINYDGTTFTDKTAAEGLKQPLLQWTPSIAPSGMAFVTGKRYKGWEGDLLTGSLRFQYLNRTDLEGNEVKGEEKLLKNIGRLRNVKMGPDGYLYIALEAPARIFKLVPVEEPAK